MNTKEQKSLLAERVKDMGLAELSKPSLKPLTTRTSVLKNHLQSVKDILKGPIVYLPSSIYLTPGHPQGKLKSHLSFFQASMVLTESAAGKSNNQVLFGSRQNQNGQWAGSEGTVQVEFETEDTKTAYLVEFHLNFPTLTGPPMQWNLTLVGYSNAILSTTNHSFGSSQKGNRVLQFFIAPSALRSQFVLLRPTSGGTSTWALYGVEITAFKSI